MAINTGRIIKGIAGFYYVDIKDIGVVECHAAGRFRKEGLKPLVGDIVDVEILDYDALTGSIVSVRDRISMLYRPEVANVSQALVVFAYAKPEPNLNLLDKFLIMLSNQNIECAICFNKSDLVTDEEVDRLAQIYKDSGVKIFCHSAKRDSVDSILAYLNGKVTAFAGPSGVGKSTLINAICPGALMETGDISKKLSRGKHTTRHSELFKVNDDTYIMDTPGFTSFELLDDITKDTLKSYYPEFYDYEGCCRFEPCSHTHEPKCIIKEKVDEGVISRIRYDGYVNIYKELENRRSY